MLHNILNNSFSIPPSFSNTHFSDIFEPIVFFEIKKKKRAKTPEQVLSKFRKLNKAITMKNKKQFRRSQESIVAAITADTLVNRLPFLYEENRKQKNYERIYFEILKLFGKKNNEENDGDNYYTNQRHLNISSTDLDSFYTLHDYINIMKKQNNVRTMHDIYLIMHVLSKTDLSKSFRDEFNNEEIYGKLIAFCSMELKYKKFKKGKKIFNIGDIPDYFYIILNGRVDIIKPIQVKVFFTGNEYFLYLMKLLKDQDRYTYDLCIENNELNFAIEKGEAKYLPYIYIFILLGKRKTDLFFNEIISSVNITPAELGLTEEEVMDDIFVRKNADKIKFFFPYKITTELVDKYYFIADQIIQKDVFIYQDQKFLSLETNSYFGDSTMDSSTTRNATVIASEDTDVGYLEMKLYHTHISQEKIKLNNKKLRFFIENFFFQRINILNFEKKYFSLFIANYYTKGDVIFNEDQKADFVYFIEEGIVELTTSKNIVEIQMLIKILENKRNNIEQIFSQFRQEGGQEFLYNNIDNNCGDLLKYINRKEKHKIIILKNNEDIGLISFFFDCPYIADCVVVSNTAKIHKIDFRYLNQILSSEKLCVYNLIKRINHKLKVYQERLFNINNTKLSIADQEETLKNKEKMDLIRDELAIIEKKKNKIRNDKSREKENKAEIEKFHDICLNFYSNKINKKNDKSKKIKLKNFLNNSVLPSIKSERPLNKNKEKYKKFSIISKLLSTRNTDKTDRIIVKNKSQINLLFNQKNQDKKFFPFRNTSGYLFKDSTKENINNNKNVSSKLNSINAEKDEDNSKEKRKKDKDYFLRYFKKYAINNTSLNSSLIFNKIKIIKKENKKEENESNSKIYNVNYNQVSSSINNNKDNNKNDDLLISRNQKLTTFNSNDNIFFSSQKITSKHLNALTTIKNNKNPHKKFLANSINNEVNKNDNIQINAYTDRKNVNKSISHPYYSPSVIFKKLRYGLFMKHTKKEQKIDFKSNKDFGFFHFSLGKIEQKKI